MTRLAERIARLEQGGSCLLCGGRQPLSVGREVDGVQVGELAAPCPLCGLEPLWLVVRRVAGREEAT